MTEDRMALVDLLQKSGDGDFLRAVAEAVLQILMETDVEGLIGAGRHERSTERLNRLWIGRDPRLDGGAEKHRAACPGMGQGPAHRRNL
jgi:putative transposase